MPLELKPNRVDFGQVPRSSPTQNKAVTMLRGDGGPIAPEVLPGRQPGIHAQVCEIEPGEHYELEVSLGPPWPEGKLAEVLRLKTGVAEAPSMTVLVTGSITPRLTAVPNRVTFPADRAEESEQTVRLQWDGGKPAKILEVTTTLPEASVRVDEGKKGQQTLVVTLPAGSEPVTGRHTVTIKTDDPDVSTFSVPINFQRQSGARKRTGTR